MLFMVLIRKHLKLYDIEAEEITIRNDINE